MRFPLSTLLCLSKCFHSIERALEQRSLPLPPFSLVIWESRAATPPATPDNESQNKGDYFLPPPPPLPRSSLRLLILCVLLHVFQSFKTSSLSPHLLLLLLHHPSNSCFVLGKTLLTKGLLNFVSSTRCIFQRLRQLEEGNSMEKREPGRAEREPSLWCSC